MTYDRAPAPPTVRESRVVDALLFVFALSLANEVYDWRVVGDYDWEAIVAVTLLGAIFMAYSKLTGPRR